MSTRPTDRPDIAYASSATPRRLAGRATPAALGVVAVLALALGAVGYLAYQRLAGGGQTDPSSGQTKSEAAIAVELGNLQTEFQTLMQEKLDLDRFEARVLAFTREHPDQADGYVLLAQVQTRMQKWAPAYAALVRALADDPQVVELHKMAGACAAKLDRLDQAQQHYLDAIAAAGSAADSGVYNALGQIYIARGDSDAAEQAFNQALKAPGERD